MLPNVLSAISHHYEIYFPGVQGPPRILSTAMEHRRLSDLARVRLQLGESSTEIYIKFHKHPSSPEERVRVKAQLEYETLRQLSAAFAAIPGYSVVRPIAYFSEYKAVVTEKAEGTTLHQHLNRPLPMLCGINRKRLEGWCYHAGCWLRKFQELTARPETEKFEASRFRDEIENVLQRCETLGLSHRFREQCSAWLTSELKRLGDSELEVVGQHPDFQPQNILVNSTGVTVLDFTSFRYGHRYHDVASFATWLDSRSKHPFFRPAQLDRLWTNFLRGYQALVFDDPLLRLFRIKALLNYCVTFLVRTPGAVGSRFMLRRFFLRWAERSIPLKVIA